MVTSYAWRVYLVRFLLSLPSLFSQSSCTMVLSYLPMPIHLYLQIGKNEGKQKYTDLQLSFQKYVEMLDKKDQCALWKCGPCVFLLIPSGTHIYLPVVSFFSFL